MRILSSLCLVTMLSALNGFALENNQVDSSATITVNIEEGFHGGGFGGGGFHPGPAPGYGPLPPPFYYGGGFGPRPYPPFNRGGYPWPVWNHPLFQWPAYDWQWNALVSVTCTAVNAFGNVFPVTETGYAAEEWQLNLAYIQEAALNECYAYTGGDESCQPLECSPAY